MVKKEQLVYRVKIMSFKLLVDDHVDTINYQDKSSWDKDF